ncbi:MspA family porin [Nocardia sp. NPDC050710]|uniref:MspA family porin n=1 Tax=Nocardia sp. NPDC050710 TaxID=3157220 RepID=UPI00340B21BD
MSYKSVLTTILAIVVVVIGVLGVGAGTANAFVYAAHENNYATPTGFQFTVGHTDLVANPVPPQNGLPTTREVFLNNTSHGRVDSPGTGTLKTGYLVSCMVGIDLTFGAHVGAGFDAGFTLGIGGTPDELTPSVDAGIGPEISASVDLDLTVTPGVIEQVEVGTKTLSGGTTGYVMSRDFHLLVEGCGGPLSIRPYTRIEVESPEATTNGAVYGDVIAL